MQAIENMRAGGFPLIILQMVRARSVYRQSVLAIPNLPHCCAIVHVAAKHWAEWFGRCGKKQTQFRTTGGPYSA